MLGATEIKSENIAHYQEGLRISEDTDVTVPGAFMRDLMGMSRR